jgi:hypothetical protein
VADADDGRVVAGGVGHRSAAYDVVGDDQASRAGEVERPAQVLGVAALVGVDEDEVERTGALSRERRQRVEAGADANLDDVGESGPDEVRLRDLRVARVGFERYEPPAGREPSRQPDRADAGQRADLQDRPRALQARQQLEEPSLQRRDVWGGRPAAELAASAASSVGSGATRRSTR